MALTPSWIKNFERPRSSSVQPNSQEYWDAAKNNLYQPLKWQPNYHHGSSTSPLTDNGISPSPSQSKLPRSSLASLHPILEDEFMDGPDGAGRQLTGRHNSAFELQDRQSVSDVRRFSDTDILNGRYQRRTKNSDNGNYRKARSSPKRKSVDYSIADDKSERSDVRSESSARSGRSATSDSCRSEDTQLMSVSSSRKSSSDYDSLSTKSDKRDSGDAGRRKSVDVVRGRSASVVSKTMQSDSAAAFAQIEIPLELLESPSKRLKRMLGPVIMCILVVTLAASLGAAIYFATVLKDTQQQTIEELVKANLELRIRSAAQTEDLSTMSYQRLRSIGDGYCKQMDIFYRESAVFKKTYRSCHVISIKNGKINFTLLFDNQEITTKDILRVIEEKAEKVDGPTARVALVDKLKVELGSAKIIMERVKNPDSDNPEVTKTVIKEPAVGPLLKSRASAKPLKTNSTPSTDISENTTTTTTTPTTERNTTELIRFIDGVTQGESCVGNHGGYLAHHAECNLFYRCQEGNKILFACAGDLVFDINKKVCVHRSNYDLCPEEDTHSTDPTGFDWGTHDPWDPCKTSPEVVYFPHPRECNLFFQCSHNMSIVRVCQTGLLYDWKNKICVPKSNNVICPDPTQITPTRVEPGNENKTTNIKYPARPVYDPMPCKNATSLEIFPHPDNCSLYIMCDSSGQQATAQCPVGMLYDPAVKACTKTTNQMPCPDIRPCVYKSGVYFPHPTLCHLFIFCSSGKEVVQTCAKGMVWDPTIDSCVLRTATSACPPKAK
ncbi:uncharacterized protein LOC121373963 [Gigantopelta aegis]|uniref:uncharacterized protein LOC121373963 n=1 Tax=Gigantopelta aegis TaxID=1735272 RepID=UPI001B88CCAC|nr:uncharacterized protein LOC121373963 [Gigantopelta aegis]